MCSVCAEVKVDIQGRTLREKQEKWNSLVFDLAIIYRSWMVALA